jgi:nucleoside-diphosphate-sugar epimerase
MRVLVTGASGWIGSAVVPELNGAGHQVIGLARSDESAAARAAAGAEVLRGSLDDLEVLGSAAARSDGVVHLAFKHDMAFTGDFAGAVDADKRAIEALSAPLAGTDRPFVIASGLLGAAPGRTATEADGVGEGRALEGGGLSGRMANAQFVLSLASRGVRSSVLRLPPTVHGEGDNGFIPMQIAIAREKGVSGYVGDGLHRWPAIHRSDAARLFRLALEQAPAGTTLHAVGDEGVPVRDIAEVIGRHLDLPVASVAAQDAFTQFGWLGGPLSIDAPSSAQITQRLLGWHPTGPALIDDLDKGHYF